MQQTIENSKLLSSILIFTIGILLFTGCNPSEPKLELQSKNKPLESHSLLPIIAKTGMIAST